MKTIKNLWSHQDEENLIVNIFIAFAIKGISLFSMPLYIDFLTILKC